jgi:hypothetical protein
VAAAPKSSTVMTGKIANANGALMELKWGVAGGRVVVDDGSSADRFLFRFCDAVADDGPCSALVAAGD